MIPELFQSLEMCCRHNDRHDLHIRIRVTQPANKRLQRMLEIMSGCIDHAILAWQSFQQLLAQRGYWHETVRGAPLSVRIEDQAIMLAKPLVTMKHPDQYHRPRSHEWKHASIYAAGEVEIIMR